MKIKFLKDSEPYEKGDVVEVADDSAEDAIRIGVAKQADPDEEVKIQAVDRGDRAKAETPEEIAKKRADSVGYEVGDEQAKAKKAAENKAVSGTENK